MDWPLDRQDVSLFFSDKGLIVVAPLPGNHFRIVAAMKDAPPEPSITDLLRIFEERGPENAAIAIRRIVWASRFRLEHRVVRVLLRGRILLAGDAAHVHSPPVARYEYRHSGRHSTRRRIAPNASVRKRDAALDIWQAKRLEIAQFCRNNDRPNDEDGDSFII
jgi:hypothetical protein